MSLELVTELDENKKQTKWQALLKEEVLLRITGLHVEFRTERATVNALNGLDLVIHKGESLGLVGETGAGKTTVALSILNLLQNDVGFITHGNVEYNGLDIQKMSDRDLREIRGGKIAMIFQNPLTALNPVFNVGGQIAMVLRVHQKLGTRASMKRAGELLEMVGIPSYRINDYPFELSGGMRQRVGIAAALACNPQLLIADEPTTALDVTIQAQVLELLKELQKVYSSSLLMISHNLGIISELCQRVAVMYAGRIIEYGEAKDVFTTPLHPYTKGLIGALPSLKGPRNRLAAIPGVIADAENLPSGCAFHPRCGRCQAECEKNQPSMVHPYSDHYVACFKYQEE